MELTHHSLFVASMWNVGLSGYSFTNKKKKKNCKIACRAASPCGIYYNFPWWKDLSMHAKEEENGKKSTRYFVKSTVVLSG